MTYPDDPAHPLPDPCGMAGMSIREYYAGQIMAGLTAHSSDCSSAEQNARYAVDAADALIDALNATPPTCPGPAGNGAACAKARAA